VTSRFAHLTLRDDVARMANQIASQFRHKATEDAIAGVATHLRNFWDPRMRQELKALIKAGSVELDPLAIEAAERL
jgi:formate dehydrogenase subunit delta